MNKYLILIVSFTFFFSLNAICQRGGDVLKQHINGWEIETGYFNNGQPYAKAGKGDKILIYIEELSFDHIPPKGFILKLFVKQSNSFYNDYTVYRIGRKANLPNGYTIDDMSKDYGNLIASEFKTKVDLIGVSTGGQIGLCLAANFPEYVNKAVIISAAHKVSDQGKIIERKTAEYLNQKRYGKTMSTLIELVYKKGLKRVFYKSIMSLAGRSMLKDIQYPNDFQVGVEADCNMDFKNRLKEINASTLIISGFEDIGYSIEDVKVTAAGIEHSDLIIYDKYGHDLYPDNYKEVNEDISAFLNQKH